MKIQKQVIKYIKKNYGFWIKIIAILVIAYGIKKYFFKKRSYEFEKKELLQFYKKYNIIIDKNKETLTRNNDTVSYHRFNDHIPLSIKGNKKLINDILLKNNISVCKNIKWNDNISDTENIKIINKNLNFPVVVKPLSGQQGYGIKTDISDNGSLIKHINFLKSYKKEGKVNIKKGIIIEEQEAGEKYRIFVLNGKIIYISLHTKPVIKGDGKSTINDLIKNYHIINKDVNAIKHIDKDFILQQGYKLNDILENNEEIHITNNLSQGNGSKASYIKIDTVHPDNLKMFIRVNKVLRLNLSGIDYITKDLSIPYYNSGKIIEVNGGPLITWQMLEKHSVADTFIDALFTPRKYN